MRSDWQVVLYIIYIFAFMGVAKLFKEKLGIFKSIIVPTSLLAGFLGLICGPEVLGLIHYDIEFYEDIVFHFMGIGFIAQTLAGKAVKHKGDSIKSGFFIISTYCFQGIVGMILVFLLINTFKPDLFVGLGLMLPLAYGQGPGFASSIGGSWDQTLPFGFVNQYGLTLATCGFVVGGVIGVILLNYYARKYNLKVSKLNTLDGLQSKDITLVSIKEINFYDMLTTQLAAVAIVYLFTYLLIYGLSTSLGMLGEIGNTVAGLIKGFNFLFGILLALLLKKILGFLSNRGHRSKELLDYYNMQNISSMSFNIMITASVMAISVNVIKSYWELLLVVAIGGALFTLVFVVWFGKKVYKTNPYHYILAMYGMLTGTASTGMALLRGIDPNLETDVAQNFVLGSAVATPLAIPLIILLSFPIIGYTQNNPVYYWATFGGLIIYTLLMMTLAVIKFKKKESN